MNMTREQAILLGQGILEKRGLAVEIITGWRQETLLRINGVMHVGVRIIRSSLFNCRKRGAVKTYTYFRWLCIFRRQEQETRADVVLCFLETSNGTQCFIIPRQIFGGKTAIAILSNSSEIPSDSYPEFRDWDHIHAPLAEIERLRRGSEETLQSLERELRSLRLMKEATDLLSSYHPQNDQEDRFSESRVRPRSKVTRLRA